MKMTAFFGHNIARGSGGGGGERQDEPKAEQKIVIICRVLRNNYLEELFHTVKLFCPPLWVTLSSMSSVLIYTP